SLPDMSGVLLMDVLRAQPSLHHVPIVFLTGNNREETKIAALSRGAVDFITKPFQINDLVARLHAQIRRKDEEEESRRHAANEAIAAQISLKTAENRFNALVKNSFDVVCELDATLNIAYASPNFRDVLRYAPSDLLG